MARRTKIIATVGPACEDDATLRKMVRAGMDVARLSLAHGTLDEAAGRLEAVRRTAAEEGRVVGVLVDLPGPKIRAGSFGEQSVTLTEGSTVELRIGSQVSTASILEVDYEGLLTDVEVGDRLTIGDGRAVVEIVDAGPDHLSARVAHGGQLSGRPGLHIPADHLSLRAPTDNDLVALERFLELDVDMVALSFVRSADDLARLPVDPHPQGPLVVAKIETRAAIDDLPAIIEASGAVMVARGDLGSECSIEELPILQKEIIRQCITLGRPAITATQMLESMVKAPEPTRAEASDVANAVFEQADAIMLSGETSVGEFPNRCVKAMDRIARRMEREPAARFHELATLTNDRQKLAKAAVNMADDLDAQAIVVFTRVGRLVPEVAWMRPRSAPILALCLNESVACSLTLHRGVRPVVLPWDAGEPGEQPGEAVDRALKQLAEQNFLETGDTVVVVSSRSAVEEIADSVQMCQVG